jgi:3-hydroxyisobutyrate dehydrogenase-like beta-hydroxyacid dehydrogenase
MTQQVAVAFIGLGVMGYPMAGYLQRAGFAVTVYNRTRTKAQQWVAEYAGQLADTPAEAAQQADMVFCCVGNDDDVRAVLLGEQGVQAGIKTDAVVVDHTTTSAELARELATIFSRQGNGFVDAPVSGGQAGAENACLTVMCGGDQAAFERVKPAIDSYAQCVKLLGAVGSGQLAKMVNQICVAGVVQGLAEGLHFAQQAGLDANAVIEVISKGAAQSWQMENRYQSMLAGEYDHGFAVDWMRKDLDYILQEAERNNSDLPITELINQFYTDVQTMGGGRWDTSSLLARLQNKTNQ